MLSAIFKFFFDWGESNRFASLEDLLLLATGIALIVLSVVLRRRFGGKPQDETNSVI